MSIWHRIFGRTDRDGDNAEVAAEASRDTSFIITLVVLGSRMARADGTISRNEIETFKRVFRLSPDDMEVAGQMFDQGRQDAVDFRRYALQATRQFRDRPVVLEQLLDGLFAMAYADRRLDDRELDYLREVASLLDIGDAAFARIHARHHHERNPYAVLGLDRNADEMAIRLAHRRLSQDLNPDRLIGQGLPRSLVLVAHDKAAAIDAAFAAVCKERGFAR
jgi:DnaJ like chaperone protein